MKLAEQYAEWRKVSVEMLADGFSGSVDCGEVIVRQDFSNFAELTETITFEEMLMLEQSAYLESALESGAIVWLQVDAAKELDLLFNSDYTDIDDLFLACSHGNVELMCSSGKMRDLYISSKKVADLIDTYQLSWERRPDDTDE